MVDLKLHKGDLLRKYYNYTQIMIFSLALIIGTVFTTGVSR